MTPTPSPGGTIRTSRLRKNSLIVAACAPVVLLCADAQAAEQAGPLLTLFGRSHIVLLHFPVALIIVAWAAECVARLKRSDRPSQLGMLCLLLGAASAAMTAWTGWTFADIDPVATSQADLITLHRWAGVTAAVCSVIAAGIATAAWFIKGRRATATAFVALTFAAVGVSVAGHLGGSLVHGSDFLTGVFNTEPDSVPEVSLAAVPMQQFQQNIQPIFEARCTECHGPSKRKGRLRLDSFERIAMGGRHGPVIVAGDPEGSEMIMRISLPADHEDIMPAKGDPLTQSQIAALTEWVRTLDPASLVEASTAADDQAAPTPDEPLPTQLPGDDTDLDAIIDQLQDTGVLVVPVAVGSSQLRVNASVAVGADDSVLALISRLGSRIADLDLSRTAVTDEGLAVLAGMTSLKHLDLRATAISDAGVSHLVGLASLTRLNLVKTAVTDGAIDHLANLSNLTQLFVWDTNITPAGAARLAESLPDCTVDLGLQELAEPPVLEVTLVMPDCCTAAADAGTVCDHACCIEASEEGVACAICLEG